MLATRSANKLTVIYFLYNLKINISSMNESEIIIQFPTVAFLYCDAYVKRE